jgi:hypothetical protein
VVLAPEPQNPSNKPNADRQKYHWYLCETAKDSRLPHASQHSVEHNSSHASFDEVYIDFTMNWCRSDSTKGGSSMGQGDEGREATGITGFNAHLLEQIRRLHRGWLEKVWEIRQLELDYGTKLMSAKTPSEAAGFCNEWIGKRMEIFAREQEIFASSWVQLLGDVVALPSGSSTKNSQA